MRLQVVGEQDRLGVLQVGAPGHDRLGVRLGLRDDRVDQPQHVAGDRAGVVEQVHPHEGRDLVVAAAAGAQLAAELRADFADERGLERAVHVFVTGSGTQRAVLDAAGQGIQPRVHAPRLVGGEVPGGGERLGVGVGAGDVVEREVPVEVRRTAQRRELRRGPGGEPRPPQCAFVGAVGLRIAHTDHPTEPIRRARAVRTHRGDPRRP